MRTLAFATVVVAGAAAATLAIASGGPPPAEDTDPPTRVVVAHGTAQTRVAEPSRRSDQSVERAVRDARMQALPRAVAAARDEARGLARAAGLPLADAIGIARDVGPVGWYDQDTGRFGPGRWCGPITTYRKGVRRTHHGCHMPPHAMVSVTVTFTTG